MKKSLVERIGERIPDINIIFLILTLVTIIISFFLAGSYQYDNLPDVVVNNMLSLEGFRWTIMNLQKNFIGFTPLGLVLITILGTGVAEKTGLLGTLIKKVGLSVPNKLLLPAILFLGVMSSLASDAGYIILVPLSGALFAGLGKNPLLGIAAAFAGVSAGFGANLLPTPGDALLGGITVDIATKANVPIEYGVVTMNYFFMMVSTFLITLVGWFVTSKFIYPKIKNRKYIIPDDLETENHSTITMEEKKGLRAAGIGFLIYIIILFIGYFSGFLMPFENADGKTVNLLLDYILVFMVFAFLIPGYLYGIKTGKIKNTSDYITCTMDGIKANAGVVVVAFFAGNFIGIFNHSGLGKYIATSGADFLQSSGLNEYPILLLLAFILATAFINLFMGSASAKWLLLAPIFIPMLYNSNNSLTPEVVQAAYRVADSSTNIISPLMSYMPIVLTFAQRYDRKFNVGTMMSLMYPYSFAFLLGWGLLFIGWYALGLPLGF